MGGGDDDAWWHLQASQRCCMESAAPPGGDARVDDGAYPEDAHSVTTAEPWWQCSRLAPTYSPSRLQVWTPPDLRAGEDAAGEGNWNTQVLAQSIDAPVDLCLRGAENIAELYFGGIRLNDSFAGVALHKSTAEAIQYLWPLPSHGHVPARFVLYIDGGGATAGGDSAWAVAVLQVSADDKWSFRGYLTSLVVTDSAHDQFIGVVRATGGGAELSAHIWAATVVCLSACT